VPFSALIFPPFYDSFNKSRNYFYNYDFKSDMLKLPEVVSESEFLKIDYVKFKYDVFPSRQSIFFKNWTLGKVGKQDDTIRSFKAGFGNIENLTTTFKDYIIKYDYSQAEKNNDAINIKAFIKSCHVNEISSDRNGQSWTVVFNFGNMIVLESEIEWKAFDKNGSLIHVYNSKVKSGQFSYIYEMDKEEAKGKALLDALDISYLNFINTDEIKRSLNKLSPNINNKDSIVKPTLIEDSIDKSRFITKEGDNILIKDNYRINISNGIFQTLNKKEILDFVSDVPKLYSYAKKNLHKGANHTSNLINCYNSLLIDSNQVINRSFYVKYGLITKKEWRSGPTEDVLKVKQPISGEIRQVIVNTYTDHYTNNSYNSTTATYSDDFSLKFQYGNAEYKKGYMLKNLRKAVRDVPEAIKYLDMYKRKHRNRTILSGVGISLFSLGILAAAEQFGLSDGIAPFPAVAGVLIFSITQGLDRSYKTEYTSNAIFEYNKQFR